MTKLAESIKAEIPALGEMLANSVDEESGLTFLTAEIIVHLIDEPEKCIPKHKYMTLVFEDFLLVIITTGNISKIAPNRYNSETESWELAPLMVQLDWETGMQAITSYEGADINAVEALSESFVNVVLAHGFGKTTVH